MDWPRPGAAWAYASTSNTPMVEEAQALPPFGLHGLCGPAEQLGLGALHGFIAAEVRHLMERNVIAESENVHRLVESKLDSFNRRLSYLEQEVMSQIRQSRATDRRIKNLCASIQKYEVDKDLLDVAYEPVDLASQEPPEEGLIPMTTLTQHSVGDAKRLGPREEEESQLPSLARNGPVYSQGSAQHPWNCKPCTFFCFAKRGCKKLSACEYCHMDHYRRPKRRNLRSQGI